MPLAPLGCAVQMHKATNWGRTWDLQSLNGWYLGTSPKHYRCHKIFCQKTQSVRLSHTVFFQHQYLPQPKLITEDAIVNALGDLKASITKQPNDKGEEEQTVLRKMDKLFNTHHNEETGTPI